MWIIGAMAGAALIVLTLFEGFETIVQPRRVTRRFRYARYYYRFTWLTWHRVALSIRKPRRRESFLGIYGPLSLLGLFASWITALILGFALVNWSAGTPLHGSANMRPSFFTYAYMSGTTLFTLGYGDVTPAAPLGRTLAVGESGLGFGFLAVIVSYLPVLYQAFSSREDVISLLDARAGSPPSASEFINRLSRTRGLGTIDSTLAEWERWAAQLLESHLSFPVLSYYRSQHDNQSWLAALTAIMDICAILIALLKEQSTYQAQLTFAMARHAAVDLALVLHTPPISPNPPRVSREICNALWAKLKESGIGIEEGPAATDRLAELRAMYEPFVNALSDRLLMRLPAIVAPEPVADNWQRSAWMKRTPGIGNLPGAASDEHF